MVAAVFERDNFVCQYCGTPYPPENHSLHCHHRIFVSQGGKNDLDNFASCCAECHHTHGDLKHARILSEYDDDKIKELYFRYKF